MSRSKRARAKARNQAAHAGPNTPAPPQVEAEPSRIAGARRRATAVKVGVGAAAVVSVGSWMGLARVNYPGHTKHRTEPLAIPPDLYAVVRSNLLQAGIVAPATAPPDASTATS
jgi:hypothetical protein